MIFRQRVEKHGAAGTGGTVSVATCQPDRLRSDPEAMRGPGVVSLSVGRPWRLSDKGLRVPKPTVIGTWQPQQDPVLIGP